MRIMKDLHLLPKDDSPESIRNWQLRVALVACSSWIMLYFVIIPAALTGVPRLGALAWARDVDQKVQEAIAPINDKIDRLEMAVTDQTETSNALLLELTEKTLTEMNRRRCSAPTTEDRDYWQSQMNKLKPRYLRYSGGISYEQRSCADL